MNSDFATVLRLYEIAAVGAACLAGASDAARIDLEVEVHRDRGRRI